MEPKVLLLSFGNCDYDGRLRCLIEQFAKIGDLSVVSRGSQKKTAQHLLYNGGFFGFCRTVKRYLRGKTFDYLVIDNRKACVPGLYAIRKLKPKIVVQDCRELYLLREKKRLTSKIGCVFEAKMQKRADVIISANEKRAEILQQELGLARKPLVYENLRMLQFTNDETKAAAEKKLAPYIRDGEYRVLSTAGCTVSRLNDVLVKNIDRVQKKVRLFLVGESPAQDEKTIRDIIAEKGLTNVEILGRLDQDELKCLIRSCHIGIVNYNRSDTNNTYCASGKVYEFLYEGVPVVTTTNPPLAELCDAYGIGLCDDGFFRGIDGVLADYEGFKTRVQTFTKEHTVAQNDEKFLADVKRAIDETLARKTEISER